MAMLESIPSAPVLLILMVALLCGAYLLIRRQFQSEIDALRKLVEERTRVQPVTAISPPSTAKKFESKPEPKPEVAAAPPPQDEGVTPEILAVIGAAVAQFLGASFRIRSARMLSVESGMNPWAQQGRVIIQASHNLGLR